MKKIFKPSISLINHLKYPQKFILLGTIVVCIVFATSYQLALNAYTTIESSQIELLSVEFNKQLMNIFEKIQKYRYLQESSNSKDTERMAELLAKQSEIMNAINRIEDNIPKLNVGTIDPKTLEQIKSRLSAIKEKIGHVNFSVEGGIANDIRMLITNFCDASNFALDYEIDTIYLMDSYCTKLPTLAEREVIIKEFGEKALVNHSISSIDQNELNDLIVLMEKSTVRLIEENTEKVLKKNISLITTFEPIKNQLVSGIKTSVALVDDYVLSGKFDLAPKNFSERYKELLDTTYQFYRLTGDSLTTLLNIRIKKLLSIFYLDFAIVVGGLLAFFYLFSGIYLSIIRSINLLVKGTQKIAKGALEEKVELNTRDELSEIAFSFNEMREMLSQVVQSLDQVVTDAKRGKLSNRIDLTGKEGFYKELFEDINQMSSVFNDVILDVSSVLDCVSKGNLTKKMSHDYEGSFGELKTYMNHTVESLEKFLKDIKTGTAAISHAVKEIVLGNNDLAKRTDQQAAALEETSASMEKITNTVKQNTENTKGVNDLAKSASMVALKGGSAVNQVVEMMNSINESIHEVSEISNVIDNIAFQTNILALNAAVEAARAGEQGRGFSVVATEIRNLALRSSDSAKDIKTLINTTVERIIRGAKLVDEAGQTMTEVVTAVNNVTEIMSNMANASIEQSNGIEQIYTAINQIDLVTQQNSALVEQAARASESLEQQTKHMDNLVDVFKISPLTQDVLSQEEHIKKNYLKIERRKINLPPPNGIERRKIKTAPPKSDEWTEF